MRVDAWSDVVCPWCAIGKAHLEQALTAFEHADDVDVVWRSFELDPGAPAVRGGSYDVLLAAKYSASPAGGRAMVGRLSAAAERAGVQARFDLVRPTNTFDAHRLLHLARERGVQAQVKSRLLQAYLAEGELVSDHPTLLRLVATAGRPARSGREVVRRAAPRRAARRRQATAARGAPDRG